MENVNKLLLDALKRLLDCYKMADHSDGYCCCGSPMDRHDDPMNCGHSAVDGGEYNASLIIEDVESAIAAAEQAQQAEPVAWEYREFHDDNTVAPGWGKWKRIESEEWAGRAITSVVADIHEFIAQGYRYEIRELYAQPPAVAVPDAVVGKLRMLLAACNRIESGAEEVESQDGMEMAIAIDYWLEFIDALDAARAMLAAAPQTEPPSAALAAGWPHERDIGRGLKPQYWPFNQEWWKPTTARHNLVKAGALIAAEIERIDRAAQKGGA